MSEATASVTTDGAADASADDGGARDPAVARMVHDLRNPLNTISMSAELVALIADDGTGSGELADCLAALGRSVSELERVLGQLESHVAGKPYAARG